jgi:hypothetical protein
VGIAIEKDLELSIQITGEPKCKNKPLSRKKSLNTMRILLTRGEHHETTSFWFNNLLREEISFLERSGRVKIRWIEKNAT